MFVLAKVAEAVNRLSRTAPNGMDATAVVGREHLT
jgi:hypothetical protein